MSKTPINSKPPRRKWVHPALRDPNEELTAGNYLFRFWYCVLQTTLVFLASLALLWKTSPDGVLLLYPYPELKDAQHYVGQLVSERVSGDNLFYKNYVITETDKHQVYFGQIDRPWGEAVTPSTTIDGLLKCDLYFHPVFGIIQATFEPSYSENNTYAFHNIEYEEQRQYLRDRGYKSLHFNKIFVVLIWWGGVLVLMGVTRHEWRMYLSKRDTKPTRV
jgi:hypothetical protein